MKSSILIPLVSSSFKPDVNVRFLRPTSDRGVGGPARVSMEAGEECSTEVIHGSPGSRKTKRLYSHTPDVMLIQLGDYVKQRNVEGCVSRQKIKKEN